MNSAAAAHRTRLVLCQFAMHGKFGMCYGDVQRDVYWHVRWGVHGDVYSDEHVDVVQCGKRSEINIRGLLLSEEYEGCVK